MLTDRRWRDDAVCLIVGLLSDGLFDAWVRDMNTDEHSALMYVKRRRAINRRAAAKSRAKLKERTTHVKQVRPTRLYSIRTWLDTLKMHLPKMNFLGQDFQKLEYNRQTDATQNINTPHSRVVMNTSLYSFYDHKTMTLYIYLDNRSFHYSDWILNYSCSKIFRWFSSYLFFLTLCVLFSLY